MQFALIKELVDRFIEFALFMSKGDTPEDRLTSALKTTSILITALTIAVAGLAIDDLNIRREMKDYESAISKLGFLLKPENMVGSAKAIGHLTDSIDSYSNTLRKENSKLAEANVTLFYENYWIQVLLSSQNKEVQLLRQNNSVLLAKCTK